MASNQSQFASEEWLQVLEAEMRKFVASLTDGKRFSISEVYTKVPPEVNPAPAGRVAWTARIDGSDVSFVRGEAEDVDLKVEGEYEHIRKAAIFVVSEDNEEEYQAIAAQAIEQGRITVDGDMAIVADMQPFHNIMAARSA